MKHSFFSVLFLFVCISINALTYLCGKVTDKEGNILSGASVFMPDRNKSAVCDDGGEYRIDGVHKGKVIVRIYYMGYNPEIFSVNVKSGKNELNVMLSECSVEMPDIVVSGGTASSQRDNAVKIDILKAGDIYLSGTPNLMEALSSVPGVDMISKGQGLSKPVIRGLSMNGILIARNGIRIENYQYSVGHTAGIDDNGASKVEIIKGPASLLYGSDAIGGVINFVGEKASSPGTVSGKYLSQYYSNTAGFSNSLSIKGASKHFFAGAGINYKSHADYKQGGGEYVPNSRFNEWSANINTGYHTGIGTFGLSWYYYKQEVGLTVPNIIPLITKRGRKNRIWYQDPHHHLISSRNKLYIGNIKCDLNAAWQSNLQKAHNTVAEPFVEMRLNTFTYDAKVHLPSGDKSDYVVGIQGMEQVHKNVNNRLQQSLPDAYVSRIGAMAFVSYTVLSCLKLQGGLRLDYNSIDSKMSGEKGMPNYRASLYDDFVSPNGSVGATYRISEKMTLRANFAKACRMPNLRELLFTGLKGNRYEMAGKNLDPEDAYESDVSFHYSADNLSFDVALFYNHINDYIYLAPTAETTADRVKIFRISQDNANLYGGEAGVHYHPVFWLHIKGSYSSVTGKREGGMNLPYIPANKFRYEIGFERKSIWRFKRPEIYISALTALSQDHPSMFETKVGGYTIFNIKADTRINVSGRYLVIGLSANNVFDKKYIDHLSTLKSMNYYNQGRDICLSLKVPFCIK